MQGHQNVGELRRNEWFIPQYGRNCKVTRMLVSYDNKRWNKIFKRINCKVTRMLVSYDRPIMLGYESYSNCKVTRMLVSYDNKRWNKIFKRINCKVTRMLVSYDRPIMLGYESYSNCKVTRMLVSYDYCFTVFLINNNIARSPECWWVTT